MRDKIQFGRGSVNDAARYPRDGATKARKLHKKIGSYQRSSQTKRSPVSVTLPKLPWTKEQDP